MKIFLSLLMAFAISRVALFAAAPKFTIEKADYGIPDDPTRMRDATNRLWRILNSGDTTFCPAILAEGDDPAPGVLKSALINYTSNGESLSEMEMDSGEITIKLPTGLDLPAIRAMSGQEFDPESLLTNWIVDPVTPEAEELFFQGQFELPAQGKVRSAVLNMTADNRFEVFVNGKPAGSGDNWNVCESMNVASLLHQGVNVISVAIQNPGGPGGLIGGVEVVMTDGTRIRRVTDAEWLSTNAAKDWKNPKAETSGWRQAIVVGNAYSAPWALVKP